MSKLKIKALKKVNVVGLQLLEENEELEIDESVVEEHNLIERFAAKADIIEVIGWDKEEAKPKIKSKKADKEDKEEAKPEEDTTDEAPSDDTETSEDDLLGEGVELDK